MISTVIQQQRISKLFLINIVFAFVLSMHNDLASLLAYFYKVLASNKIGNQMSQKYISCTEIHFLGIWKYFSLLVSLLQRKPELMGSSTGPVTP